VNKKILIAIIAAGATISCSRHKLPVIETGSQHPMPNAWIDKDTGHEIIRLTRREGNNRSFYFHNNPFIPAKGEKGTKMVFYGTTEQKASDNVYRGRFKRQIFDVDLNTLKIDQITHENRFLHGEIVGKKHRAVYYQSGDSVFETNIDSHKARLIKILPDSIQGGVTTLNANETLLALVTSVPEKMEILRNNPKKGDYFTKIFEAKLPHTLMTLNIETGELKKVFSDTAWLNHVQFSPTDPNLLMFCHEGPWHKVDRIWTIDLSTGKVRKMHTRTMNMEIAGHEFFSPDGKTIWFDLQMPRGKTFYLAGVDVKSGKEKKYALKRNEWSIHYNISPDEKLFAGDGGDSSQVAHAKDGMWIYLFHPEGDSLSSEKLVNMKNHDYDLEPNVHFSPDGKWIIFRANFDGSSQAYAVKI